MRVIVAGAGAIGYHIIKILVGNKHDVVAIDKDRETCEVLYAETGVVVLHGSATDIRTLEKAGAGEADVMACLMRNDADNIAAAILAKSLGVSSTIGLLRKPEYEQAYRSAGITHVISTTELLSHQIIMEIEQPAVKKLTTLGGGRAEVYAVQIPPNAVAVGMAIREITQQKTFPEACVFVGIYHEDKDQFSIPRGDHKLHKWDTVFLVTNSQNIRKAAEFLTRIK
jgi:trk system potassium uptake protein TrkA